MKRKPDRIEFANNNGIVNTGNKNKFTDIKFNNTSGDDSKYFMEALSIFNEILENIESFGLSDEDKMLLAATAKNTKPLAESKTERKTIMKALSLVSDVMKRATGSLTAQGILYLIQQIPRH